MLICLITALILIYLKFKTSKIPNDKILNKIIEKALINLKKLARQHVRIFMIVNSNCIK